MDRICFWYVMHAPSWGRPNWCLERAGRWGFSDDLPNAESEALT